MSWNGSDKEKAKNQGAIERSEIAERSAGLREQRRGKFRSSTSTHNFNYKALLAGLIVVIGGGLAAWMMMRGGRGENGERGEKKPSQIAEVKPAVVTNAIVAEEAVAEVAEKPVPYWKLPTTNGLDEVQIRKWKFMHEPPPRYTNNAAFHRPPPAYAIFRHRSENELAMLMTMEPGSVLVGSPVYDDKMRQDFLKSCEEPILAAEGDTEEQRQLKKDMNELKIEIRERMRNGEDFCDILRETREEMVRLNQIKKEIQGDLAAMLKEVDNADAAAVCIEAANKLLESKGIAPLPDNPLVRKRLEMRFSKRQQ